MKLVILEEYDKVCEWAARYIKKRIIQFAPTAENLFVLGLPTGSTPQGVYKRLVKFYEDGELSFKFVKTFNMDEYVGQF